MPVDARGVEIAPGDIAIYGFGVSRSVAMAEAVVLGTDGEHASWTTGDGKVSLTASGRVRLRVVRRSYSSGEKPIVDVAPDRLVVLKSVPQPPGLSVQLAGTPWLPPSPLPTQDEVARAKIVERIEREKRYLESDEVPYYWDGDLHSWHTCCAEDLAQYERKLRALDGG